MKKTSEKNKTYTYLLAILLVGLKLSSFLYPIKVEHVQPPKEEWINVFAHGIMSIKPHISWNNFMRFVKDDVENTLYSKTVELMREDPFFYKNQAMQQIGFHRIDPTLFEGNSSASLAFTFDEISKHYGIEQTNRYYTYGWSGLLSAKSRYSDAQKLFIALEQEVAQLRKQNIIPRIRIIGYSHGGNVGLNLALVQKKEFPQSSLTIDELVMIGTPVITDTDYLINDKMFKKIFNLYSLCDRVQPLDFFAPNQFFSNRIFKPRKGLTIPDKVVQIQLKVTRCKGRIQNNPASFAFSKDFSKPSVVYGKSGLLRDISPGHVELWFFGWTPLAYRPSYPLYPLPTISFAPVITHHAAKLAKTLSPQSVLVADIRPQHNVILFRSQYNTQVHSTVPYMPQAKLKKLGDAILQCKPSLYSDDIYNAHIQDAVRNAQYIMQANRKEK